MMGVIWEGKREKRKMKTSIGNLLAGVKLGFSLRSMLAK